MSPPPPLWRTEHRPHHAGAPRPAGWVETLIWVGPTGPGGTGRASVRADESLTKGARRDFRPTLRVELLEDVAQVVLHRVLRDPELQRDLLVASSCRHEP